MSINIIFVVLSSLVLIEATVLEWDPAHPPFDPDIYKEALDPELCAKQLEYLTLNDTLLMMTCKYCERLLFIFCINFRVFLKPRDKFCR